MRSSFSIRLAAACALATLAVTARAAAPENADAVQSVWRPVEIKYSYVGFTTAYDCDSFEDKMERILATLDAPAGTKVQALGCRYLNRPDRNFFVTITTAVPVPVEEAEKEESKKKTERELIKRLGGTKALPEEPFQAAWKTVDLGRDRRLRLEPGDCELMEGLRDHVLPKLRAKIVKQTINCTPNQLGITTPELVVSVLAPLPSPDEPER
ncbi:MAG TPA: hypothetical protein VF161_03690 [Steroidobacteraceae bacterium]